jgi:ABC-type nickel/cobalt efflux system permease component RcnA
MRIALGVGLAAFVALALWFWLSGEYAAAMQWAVAQQRGFQNELAALIIQARKGESGIVWGLILASGLYGFVHALGPGHGKFLIGGAGLGSRAKARTMAALAMVSALAQGVTAVLLVYVGMWIVTAGSTFMGFGLVGTRWAENATNDVLTPLSYAVIAVIGAVLIWRGGRVLWRQVSPAPAVALAGHSHGTSGHDHDHHHHHAHDEDCGCGHRHGPTVEQIENLHGWRDAAVLIAGIAIRPCTGAVIVLVIAWQTGLHLLGLGAVFAMALGTGAFTALVALASVSVREASFSLSGSAAARLSLLAPALQLAAGGLILVFALGLLSASLG